MVSVSPPGNSHHNCPNVVVDDDGSCTGCLYKIALAYLLDHCTGTGTLTLTSEELNELGPHNIKLLQVRRAAK